MENMQQVIDDIFERIKIPESGLSLSQSNIIEKIRYVKSMNKLIVFKYPLHSKACCGLISDAITSRVINQLHDELKKAFPGFYIDIA